MDAVRWVLGESKASELRGESMEDVISTAPPAQAVSRASVELVFDNSLGHCRRPVVAHAELSSSACCRAMASPSTTHQQSTGRRKGHHRPVPGTGLGPRAYAIIGRA